jgi:hypothetical protein
MPVNKVLRILGRVVPSSVKQRARQRLRDHFRAPNLEWSLKNLRRLGFQPKTALDVGAFKGEWTAAVRDVFPQASVLMLDAQESRRVDLEQVAQAHRGFVDYRIALLGSEEREDVVFNEYPTIRGEKN